MTTTAEVVGRPGEDVLTQAFRRARGLLPTHTSGRHSHDAASTVKFEDPSSTAAAPRDVTDVPRAARITPSRTRPIVLNDALTAKAAAFSRYFSGVPPEFR